MNVQQAHDIGVVDARTAVLISMVNDGWQLDRAREVLDSITPAGAGAGSKAPWTPWSDEHRQVVMAAVAANDGFWPTSAAIREVAAAVGRTPKAVTTLLDRLGTPRRNPRKVRG